MPDLDLFCACFFGACPLLIFGLAFLATRDRYTAEAEQFPSLELPEMSDVAPVGR